MTVSADTHKAKFKKLGLMSHQTKLGMGWDYKDYTLAHEFKLTPKAKVLMDDLEDYLIDKGYSHVTSNRATLFTGDGKPSKFRCHYYRKKKFDFIVVFTRQRQGKKEYVTTVEHHYQNANELMRKPPKSQKATVPKKIERKRLSKNRR